MVWEAFPSFFFNSPALKKKKICIIEITAWKEQSSNSGLLGTGQQNAKGEEPAMKSPLPSVTDNRYEL